MQPQEKSLPLWILLLTGFFAVLEIGVSIALYFSPQTMLETIDLHANGVEYVVRMWAVRQFALGVILGFATWKKSVPMLTLSTLFLLIMFMGDLIIGVTQQETPLIISALIMCCICSALLYALRRQNHAS